jgi:hypothetical protein
MLRSCEICVVCALLSCFTAHATAAKTKHRQVKQTEFGTGIKTGSTIIQYHDTCVWVQVFFISDEFFKELQVKELPTGPEFNKNDLPVDDFPDPLIVDVEATVYRCTPKPNEIIPPDYAAGLMTGASFWASWRMGTETRSAPLLFTKERHRPGLRWDYFVGVPAKNVALTGHLLLDVSLRQGISRTSLSVGLVSPHE